MGGNVVGVVAQLAAGGKTTELVFVGQRRPEHKISMVTTPRFENNLAVVALVEYSPETLVLGTLRVACVEYIELARLEPCCR